MSEEYIHQYSDTVETIISLRKKEKEILELRQAVKDLECKYDLLEVKLFSKYCPACAEEWKAMQEGGECDSDWNDGEFYK